MRAILLAAMAMAWSHVSHAEVRAVPRPGGLHVDVRVVEGSAWTLPSKRPSSPEALNPRGADTDDGLPGVLLAGERVALAWVRGDTAEVMVTSLDQGGREERRFAIQAQAPVGVPVIHRHGDDFIVLWQEQLPSPQVNAALFIPERSVGAIAPIQDGEFIDAVTVGGDIVTLSVSRDSGALNLSVIPSFRPLPVPIPIPVSIVTFDLGNPDLLRQVSGTSRLSSVDPCIRTNDAEIVLAWPSGDETYDKVTVSEGMIDGPVTVRGRNCPSVLNSQRD